MLAREKSRKFASELFETEIPNVLVFDVNTVEGLSRLVQKFPEYAEFTYRHITKKGRNGAYAWIRKPFIVTDINNKREARYPITLTEEYSHAAHHSIIGTNTGSIGELEKEVIGAAGFFSKLRSLTHQEVHIDLSSKIVNQTKADYHVGKEIGKQISTGDINCLPAALIRAKESDVFWHLVGNVEVELPAPAQQNHKYFLNTSRRAPITFSYKKG